MTRRSGPRPKHPAIRLVTATHRADRHGPRDATRKAMDAAQSAFGEPIMPDHFAGEARKAWERYIAPAWWLDRSREPAAIILCELWQELCNNPGGFPAAKHSQLRAYMAELGLTDERNRFGIGRDKGGDPFFDD